jgi:hypothetical protein
MGNQTLSSALKTGQISPHTKTAFDAPGKDFVDVSFGFGASDADERLPFGLTPWSEMCHKWEKTWTVFQGLAKPHPYSMPCGWHSIARFIDWAWDGRPQGVFTKSRLTKNFI